MPTLTWEQVKGVADRLVAMFLVWAVSKGWIDAGDVANLTLVIIGLLSLAWGYWVNRPRGLVESAATVPNTIIATQARLADVAAPNVIPLNQATIVAPPIIADTVPQISSTADVMVVPKAA